jgi:hypothetical protein
MWTSATGTAHRLLAMALQEQHETARNMPGSRYAGNRQCIIEDPLNQSQLKVTAYAVSTPVKKNRCCTCHVAALNKIVKHGANTCKCSMCSAIAPCWLLCRMRCLLTAVVAQRCISLSLAAHSLFYGVQARCDLLHTVIRCHAHLQHSPKVSPSMR